MALTNSGFDGKVTEADWANMFAMSDADAVESSAAWAITQGTGRQVAVAANSGYAFARGVLSKDTAPILTSLGTPVNGQWFLIVRHIVWSTNTVTVAAIAHSTTTTTIPTVAPTTFPTIDNNAGVSYDQKLGWAWVRSTDTTVTIFDLRKLSVGVRVAAVEADVVVLKADTGWVDLTPIAPFAANSFAERPQLRRINGIVYTKGIFASTGMVANGSHSVATIPPGFFPPVNIITRAGTSNGASAASLFFSSSSEGILIRPNATLSSYYGIGGVSWPTT